MKQVFAGIVLLLIAYMVVRANDQYAEQSSRNEQVVIYK